MIHRTLATLVYFRKDNEHLITATNHYDLAFIRAYLIERGMHTTVYLQQELKLVQDVVDDIQTNRNHVILFYVDDNNYFITQMISQKLKMVNPDYKIIWTGFISEKHRTLHRKNSLPDKLIVENIAENVYQSLLSYEKKIEDSMPFEHDSEHTLRRTRSSIHTSSPYGLGIIQAKKAPFYGIRFNQAKLNGSLDRTHIVKQMVEDFHVFHSQGVEGTIPFIDEDILSDYEQFKIFMEFMTPQEFPFTFFGRIHSPLMSLEIINEFARNHFSQLEIHIRETDYKHALLNIPLIHKECEAQGMSITYAITLPTEKGNNQAGLIQLIHVINEIHGIKSKVRFLSVDHLEKETTDSMYFKHVYPRNLVHYFVQQQSKSNQTERYKGRLLNGYLAYETGLYPFGLNRGNSKHVGVYQKYLPSDTYDFLEGFLGVNSAVIYHSEQKQPNSKDRQLYNLTDYVVRETNENYEQNMAEARRRQTFLPHYHQVHKTEEINVETIQIDDIHHGNPIKMQKVPYKEAKNTKLRDGYNFLSIRTQEDLQTFLSDIDYYIHNGQFRHMYEISSLLIDSCRWAGSNHCTLSKLHRFHLDEDQNILPCGGCSRAIGSVKESYIQVVHHAIQISEEEQHIRGCNNCPVKDTCSKCAMLPDFMSSSQYCEIRRKYKYIDDYMEVSNLLNDLLHNRKGFENVSVQDVKISTKKKAHFISNDLVGKEASIVKKHVYVMVIDETPYIIDSIKLNMLQVNPLIAMILEGLIKNVSRTFIVQEICTTYNLDSNKANNLFLHALKKLRELHYIDEKMASSIP